MILRVYRLTDKLGLVILKLTSALGAWLLDGVTAMTSVTSGFVGMVVSFLLLIFSALLSLLVTIVGTIISGSGSYTGKTGVVSIIPFSDGRREITIAFNVI